MAKRGGRGGSADMVAAGAALVAIGTVARAAMAQWPQLAPPFARRGAVAGDRVGPPSPQGREPLSARATPSPVDPRGKTADAPIRIPPRGWKEIGLRMFQQMTEDRLLAVAAGVTFYALLALFPAIVALVSLYGLTADLTTLDGHLDAFAGVVPASSLGFVREQVARIVTKSDGALGFAFAFGLGVALWSANAGMKAMFDALNVVYGEREKRSFVTLNLLSLLFTAGALAFVLLAFNAVVVLPIVLSYVGLGGAEPLLSLGRWPALLLVVILGLSVLYRFGPSRSPAKWRWITPGSLLASALWIAGSLAFSWYAENIATYNETYGSLGAAIGFMTWIWMSGIVVLVGGELNAEIEHQTEVDSTTGRPRPLGARGAQMADTVAP
ncbi:membrane protein [Methylopila capsulata]|uniref:Membrane protein n=1 Tax=Methylopila capsulata TaxID=61654 RepID=A0A9W6IW80_9HYPH|nr:YihY/virulence factor BrkB family protein [Methylopila capsulata]MBM7853036.1 membrane protein [Methylopila capsulata]GLK57751.1 hypothetical protein GCM10008170_37710 [Methylopila capsulata]